MGLFLVAASLSLAIMLLTEPLLAIVWDEGYSLGREARVRDWFRALSDPVAFAERWRPPVEDLVPAEPHRRRRPDQFGYSGRACSARPPSTGSGRSPARNPTAIPRSMRWWVWSET